MITMEFDELKKIWDSQNNKQLYAIDEEALQRRIASKKNKSSREIGKAEMIMIVSNIIAIAIIAYSVLSNDNGNIFTYLLAGSMALLIILIMISRIMRLNSKTRFESTMLGDLDHAIKNVGYSLKFSQAMQWVMIVIALFTTLSSWSKGMEFWKLGLVMFFFIAGYYALRWEYRCVRNQMLRLTRLRDNLQQEA